MHLMTTQFLTSCYLATPTLAFFRLQITTSSLEYIKAGRARASCYIAKTADILLMPAGGADIYGPLKASAHEMKKKKICNSSQHHCKVLLNIHFTFESRPAGIGLDWYSTAATEVVDQID